MGTPPQQKCDCMHSTIHRGVMLSVQEDDPSVAPVHPLLAAHPSPHFAPGYASMQIIEFQSLLANAPAPIVLQQMQKLRFLQFPVTKTDCFRVLHAEKASAHVRPRTALAQRGQSPLSQHPISSSAGREDNNTPANRVRTTRDTAAT